MKVSMMRLIFALNLIFICLSLAPSAQAEALNFHCEALDNPSTYKDKQSYKTIVFGGDKNEWAFRSKKDFKQDFSLTPETIEKFVKLDEILKSKGQTLHIVMAPTRGIIHEQYVPKESDFVKDFNYDTAKESFNESLLSLKNAGISIADLTDVPNNVADNFYYKRDHHWTHDGAKYSALKTADLLKPHQQSFETKAYKTEVTDKKLNTPGSFELFIEEVCGITIPNQEMPEVKTFSEASDLFSEEQKADIVLIGTSNTTEPGPSYANFAGYLRDFLQTDVENQSIQGAGIFTPIASYLAKDRKDRDHKHIVWELASHYDFNGKEFDPIFKQIIPTAAGSCNGTSIFDSSYVIEQEKIDLYKSDNIKADYIELKFDKVVKDDFAVMMTFADDTKKRFRFKRVKRYPHEGVYFLDLKSFSQLELKEISALVPKNLKGQSVQFNLCLYSS
jgi:alginate biosynthesis protein AlgX